MKTPKTVPIPIRLDLKTRDRLRYAARRMGASTSAIIRFAVVNQLPQIEAGVITLTENLEAV